MNLNKKPYKSQKLLGRGESSTVYQAIERATGKKIALKVSKPRCERSIQEEGELTQKIARKIPYVRRVVNLGKMPTGEFYVAYEFVEETLATYLKERRKQNKPFALSEAAEILMPIAQALDQLHYHFKIAHSDLKPDNILIGEEGSVRLADFGNATPFGTRAQQVSPFYMTPEQANNQPCQPASDIYGLALILYEMLTLSRPILGDNAVTMSIQVLKQKPIPIQDLRPDIKPRLAQNIMRGLQKAATARPKKASALLAGFPPPKIKYGPPISRPPKMPMGQPDKKKSRSKWPLLALLGLSLLLIFGGGGYVLGLFDDFLEEPTIAEEASTEESSSVSPEPVDPSLTSSSTFEKEEDQHEDEEAEAEEPAQAEEPTEERVPNGEATATRRPTASTTRRPTATSTAPATATSSNSTDPATATSSNSTATPTFIREISQTPISEPPTATSPPPATFTPRLLITPTSVPEVTNTAQNTLLVEEVTRTVAPTFTIIYSTPSPTIAPPTVAPSATIQPTAIILPTATPPPTARPPTPTVAPQPTRTATKPPPTPANYNQAPELISPSNGEVIQSDIVTFEWNWNAPRLAQGQQFRLHGFRDGEWLELSRSSNTTVDVAMRGKGNFETNWEWYVVVIDKTGKEISPRSSTELFGISLPNN